MRIQGMTLAEWSLWGTAVFRRSWCWVSVNFLYFKLYENGENMLLSTNDIFFDKLGLPCNHFLSQPLRKPSLDTCGEVHEESHCPTISRRRAMLQMRRYIK